MDQIDQPPPLDDWDQTPAAWPRVLGTFSIVLGALGMVKNGLSCYSNIVMGGKGMPMFGTTPEQAEAVERSIAGMGGLVTVMGVVALLSFAVSAWLFAAGVLMTSRRVASVNQHKGWAMTRMLFVLVEGGLGFVFSRAMATAMLSSMPKGNGGPSPQFMETCMTVGMALGVLMNLAIGLAYPIVVLSVLGRPWAKEEIARWGRSGGSDFADTAD